MQDPRKRAIYAPIDPPGSATSLLFAPPSSSSSSRTPHAAFLRSSPSTGTLTRSSSFNSSYTHTASERHDSLSEKYTMSMDPAIWAELSAPEPDDALHYPDPKRDRASDMGGTLCNSRAVVNLGCLSILGIGILALFAGYPLISHFTRKTHTTQAALGLTQANINKQAPSNFSDRVMIDIHTPEEAKTRPSYTDPSKTLKLVFSDEFNVDGRSFYPGDDPYWEALDLHYWQTGDREWYDPAAITTRNGALEITISKKHQHDLNYTGGMITSWNKFCFTGGIVEAAVSLPGSPTVPGLWPAVWTMGNLGRVGYGASTDGTWPYTYDACDYGAIPNQTVGGKPEGALEPGTGDPYNGDHLSFLPGQRLSRCTCHGESHPGPIHSDGTYVGRAAPEIDLFEAAATTSGGNVSQSGQFAPFNYNYYWLNGTGTYKIYDYDVTALNGYHGGAYQQAVSALSIANQSCYELADGCFSVFGIEYKPGFDNAYITWVSNDKPVWTIYSSAFDQDQRVGISSRPISQEPMYIIANLGISDSFVIPDWNDLVFPATMRIDYIRVYQPEDAINYGCDPQDFPTQDYINTYIDAYTNPNYTQWKDIGQEFPKNSFLGQC